MDKPEKTQSNPPMWFGPICIPWKAKDECQPRKLKAIREIVLKEVLIPELKKWLGSDGISFFRGILKEHGKLNVCIEDGNIPHSIHFREGMQIRNKLRELTEYAWTDHEYDDWWEEIVIRAIQ